ncbi:phosphatidate cytidylyltransferase [Oricola nitratireducens]|uniref:phosphatidate cytidylyltransferase n=1 Tax=Oricola nitratireducens TaxID=2775868 RepID=UPI00186827DA
MSNLRERVLSALVLGAVVLFATLVGGWLFAIVSTAIAMLVWAEWVDVVCPNGDDRIRLLGFFFLGLVFLGALVVPNGAMPLVWAAATLLFAVASMVLVGGLWSVAGFLYSGGALVALIMLRESGPSVSGLVAVLFLFAAVWSTDIGAYFAGRHFGGPKIWTAVSPNKTWSGAIGGLVASVVAAEAVFALAGLRPFYLAALLAVVLSAVSQVGDFFESWVKRRAGVKDSSRIIPGHGGVMDRVDGLVFAAIALWILSILASGFARPSDAFFAAM